MGCICSKGTNAKHYKAENETHKEHSKSFKHLITPSKKEEVVVSIVNDRTDGSSRTRSKPSSQNNAGVAPVAMDEEEKKTMVVERSKSSQHERRATGETEAMEVNGVQMTSRIVSIPRGSQGEQIAAGWPLWLTSVAGEAIQGWVPRSAESFEKLEKIGQGTYSSVYKARDIKSGKIVAMKKVRFVNMDPESVRFMAREICILRRLNHPNVMKLEAIVTSRMSCNLFLVFEYMEHDLAGLSASPKIKFTETQIKCYMQQLLQGLEHCHSRGVLHRDIKGSNLLVDNNGVLKIGDFGLATFFQPDQTQPLTSRVVTLWYRAPELLLGATEYGVEIDLWSVGCILAELFAGKPIMPGRTEVEQMHKIFKLCGSPSEEYWRKSKLPHATSFKPQQPYKRRVPETFRDFPSSALALIDVLLAIEPKERGTAASALRSEFFTTMPLPCDPSSLPKYPPSKELDAKRRDEEARRRRAEAVKGHGSESVRGGTRDGKELPTPEFNAQRLATLQGQLNPKCNSVKYNRPEDGGTGFPLEPRKGTAKNGYSHSNSMVHPSASWTKKVKEGEGLMGPERTGSLRNPSELRRQISYMPHVGPNLSDNNHHKDDGVSAKESTGYIKKKNRIHCSGPLMPTGGNIEDMLREHERQIQEAVRKSRLDKGRTKNCYDHAQSNSFYHNGNTRPC